MKKDRVIFKDFGKITNDTKNRDERLKSYICAIFDVDDIEFDDIIKDIKDEKSKKVFIDMIYDDVNGRVRRFLEEQ